MQGSCALVDERLRHPPAPEDAIEVAPSSSDRCEDHDLPHESLRLEPRLRTLLTHRDFEAPVAAGDVESLLVQVHVAVPLVFEVLLGPCETCFLVFGTDRQTGAMV